MAVDAGCAGTRTWTLDGWYVSQDGTGDFGTINIEFFDSGAATVAFVELPNLISSDSSTWTQIVPTAGVVHVDAATVDVTISGTTVTSGQFRANVGWDDVSLLVSDSVCAAIDIKFCSNPNGFNSRRTRGVVPVTIFGTTDFFVTDIDISTVMLCNEALTMCAGPPVDSSIADRGDPETDIGASQCAIEASVEQDFLNQDGFDDLDVAFDAAQVCTVIDCDMLSKGDTSIVLVIKGELNDGTEFLSINTDVLDIKR